ncbi:MAG TPA: hypothetical protein VIT64_09075 [Ilumatobacteraceae bacterium]
MSRSRRWVIRALLVLGGILAGLGLCAGHLNRNVVDGPTFAEHVDDLRRNDAVASQVGEAISTQLVQSRPDLIALLPLVESVSVRVASSDVLSPPVRRAAEAAHLALTEPGADSVVLRIADGGAVVAAVIAAVAPERAPAAADVSVTLVSIGNQSFAETTIAIARMIGLLAWLLPLLAIFCLAGAILLSRDRWRAAMQVGWALMGAAAGVGVVLVIGGLLTRRLDVETLGGAVGLAGWQEFVRPMWWGVVVLAVLGLATIMTVGSAVPDALGAQAVRLRASLVGRPATTAGVVARAAVAGAVGLVTIADPAGSIELATFVVGIGLVLFAVIELSRLAPTAPAPARGTTADDGGGDDGGVAAKGPAPRPAALVVVGVALALALVGVVLLARPGRDVDVSTSASDVELCNGHVELCDRPFDEVAYVASHNAMSVATEPGWFIPEQIDPILTQLDQGVRALLVDVWSGRPAGSVVRTSPSSYEEALAVTEQELGPDIVAAAGRIITSVAGEPEGPEARYMCHGLCETGSTPFLETLVGLRNWLAANPTEVVTLFIEDHVDSALIASDVQAAGLLSYVHQPVVGEPWPTLAEMIGSGQRLVVMVEEGDGGDTAPWLVNGFDFTQDTPYTFPTVESFSCAANRGPSDAPLLLINHWLSGFTSLVTSAQQVNISDVLLPRAEQCRGERGQIPNFVAVNFITIGDVLTVVDELNGVA